MPDPGWVVMAAKAHCKYTVPGMDAVQVHSCLTYPTRDGASLRYDLYGAAPGQAGAPVLLVHGGPIPAGLESMPADWGLFQSLARLLAASGIPAVMFNHRFFSLDSASTAMDDIEDLLAHLAVERVCLWVFSGGGSLLGRFLRTAPECVRCLVAYYAPIQAAADAAVANAGAMPPMLIARAGLDMPQLNESIDHFVSVALGKNAPLDVLNHPTGQHGFDFRDDNARTREILARTVDFIRAHL